MKLLWVDLEMSGLDVNSCRILEIAAIVTDLNFNALATFESIIKQEDSVLEAMDEWCTEHHGASGLTEAVRSGTKESEAEDSLIEFLDAHFSADEQIILAGNSIGQDRKFLDKYWPKLAKRLHYRMLDVSSYKIIFRERYNKIFEKSEGHRALDDIKESINELKFYLQFVDLK